MDEPRFDAVTRLLAAPTSRQTVLRRLAALILGGGLAGRMATVTAARPLCA